MITARNLRNGNIINMNGALCVVVDSQHIKPGKGGAFVKTKVKNLKNNTIVEKTLRPEDTFELAHIVEKKIQFMYQDGSDYHFIDQDTFEQFALDKTALGDSVKFIKEDMVIGGSAYNGHIIAINLPPFVALKVAHTEPGIKGDTAKSSGKPATMETGLVIRVPLFINGGDIIRVDTRTGEYVGRA